MDEEQRKTFWEGVYRNRAATETSWYEAIPAISLALIGRSGVGPGDPLIDVGGGASLLVDHLLQAGYRDLTVLDVSAAALAQARERLGARATRVAWLEADAVAFEPRRRFALWHDRAAFHFLTEADDRRRYVDALCRALKPGGQVIIASFAPDGPARCSGQDIVRYDALSLARELGDDFTLEEHLRETHRTPAGREQRFGYCRFRWYGGAG